MKIGNQQCNTPSGHVRKHVSALEAATVGKHVDSPTSPAEALRRVSHCHGTYARPAHFLDVFAVVHGSRREADL